MDDPKGYAEGWKRRSSGEYRCGAGPFEKNERRLGQRMLRSIRSQTVLASGGVIIAAGLAVLPENFFPSLVQAIAQSAERGSVFGFIWNFAILLFASAPFLPLVAVGVRALTPVRIPIWIAIVLAGLTFLLGWLFTLFSAALSGPGGALIDFAFHAVLVLAAVGSILLLSAELSRYHIGKLAIGGLAVAAVASLWSLVAAGAAYAQANRIAQDAPFCVARHLGGSDIPVRSLSELRGFVFYSAASGPTGTLSPYFHGFLIVETPNGSEHFNWSLRRLQYEPTKVLAGGSCIPRSKFWRDVNIL